MQARSRWAWASAVFLIGAGGAHAAPLTADEATAVVDELLQCGIGDSYNAALRNPCCEQVRPMLSDPAVLEALRASLADQAMTGKELLWRASIISGLRLGQLADALVEAAGRETLEPQHRLDVLWHAYLLNPASDLPGRGLEHILRTGDLVQWDDRAQLKLVQLIPILPFERAAACADRFEREAGNGRVALTMLARVRHAMQWSRTVERLPLEQRAAEIADSPAQDRAIPRLAAAPGVRQQVVERIRSRLANGISKGARWTDQSLRERSMLSLLNILGEPMTQDEYEYHTSAWAFNCF